MKLLTLHILEKKAPAEFSLFGLEWNKLKLNSKHLVSFKISSFSLHESYFTQEDTLKTLASMNLTIDDVDKYATLIKLSTGEEIYILESIDFVEKALFMK